MVGGGGEVVVEEGGEGEDEEGFKISASSLLRSQLSCAIGFDKDEQIKQIETNPKLEQSDQEKLGVEIAGNRVLVEEKISMIFV